MRNFEYFTPTRVIFGKDTHLKIGTVLKEQNCSKVLIHYGSHSAVSSGLIDEIRSSLDEAGISYVTLGGVVPNPRLSKVREGIELCRNLCCRVIIRFAIVFTAFITFFLITVFLIAFFVF